MCVAGLERSRWRPSPKTGAEAGASTFRSILSPNCPGRLHPPQLPFGFEPMLTVAARYFSQREPNLVSLLRDHRLGWGGFGGRGRFGQRNAGHRNRRCFHDRPRARSGRRPSFNIYAHTLVLSVSVFVGCEPSWRLRLRSAANKRGRNANSRGSRTPGKQCSVVGRILAHKLGWTR